MSCLKFSTLKTIVPPAPSVTTDYDWKYEARRPVAVLQITKQPFVDSSAPSPTRLPFLRQFMSLSFHKTFPLECDNIAKLLRAVAPNPLASNADIAEFTGIGIGKSEG